MLKFVAAEHSMLSSTSSYVLSETSMSFLNSIANDSEGEWTIKRPTWLATKIIGGIYLLDENDGKLP